MKKLLALILAAALALSLVACGGGGSSQEEESAVTLTVTKSDGTTEILTPKEIKEIFDSNEVNYNNNYKGCEVVVEGVVESVKQEEKEIFKNLKSETAVFELTEYPTVQFWIVMGDEHYENLDFTTIENGTKVRVSGTLGRYFIDIEIDDAYDFEIITD